MSLFGALFSGVSGLQSQGSAMGAIADNVTNVNTTGYKATLVNGQVQIPAWSTSEANWDTIMDCVRDMYSRWDVTVTDVDPGDVPHIESIVTTTSSVIGMPPNVGGVSPFTLDCSPIENSIV